MIYLAAAALSDKDVENYVMTICSRSAGCRFGFDLFFRSVEEPKDNHERQGISAEVERLISDMCELGISFPENELGRLTENAKKVSSCLYDIGLSLSCVGVPSDRIRAFFLELMPELKTDKGGCLRVGTNTHDRWTSGVAEDCAKCNALGGCERDASCIMSKDVDEEQKLKLDDEDGSVAYVGKSGSFYYSRNAHPYGMSELLIKMHAGQSLGLVELQESIGCIVALMQEPIRHCNFVLIFDVSEMARPSFFDLPEMIRICSASFDQLSISKTYCWACAIVHSGSFIAKKLIDIGLIVCSPDVPPIFASTMQDAVAGVEEFLHNLAKESLRNEPFAVWVDSSQTQVEISASVKKEVDDAHIVLKTTHEEGRLDSFSSFGIADRDSSFIRDDNGFLNGNSSLSVFRTLEVTIDVDVQRIGLAFSALPPERLIIKRVVEGAWAASQGVEVGDELIQLNGRNVREIGSEEFKLLMQQRPLSMKIDLLYDEMPEEEFVLDEAHSNASTRTPVFES